MKLSSINWIVPNFSATYKLIAKPGFGNIISFFNPDKDRESLPVIQIFLTLFLWGREWSRELFT